MKSSACHRISTYLTDSTCQARRSSDANPRRSTFSCIIRALMSIQWRCSTIYCHADSRVSQVSWKLTTVLAGSPELDLQGGYTFV